MDAEVYKVYKDLLNYLSSDSDNRCEITYFIYNYEIRPVLHVKSEKKRVDCTIDNAIQ